MCVFIINKKPKNFKIEIIKELTEATFGNSKNYWLMHTGAQIAFFWFYFRMKTSNLIANCHCRL